MSNHTKEFDAFAANYEEALAEGLNVTGEDSAYYAKGRIAVLASIMDARNSERIHRILDFGCGTGGSFPWATQKWPGADYVGFDVSAASITVAQQRYKSSQVSWTSQAGTLGLFDLVLTNGVFHHIPPTERAAAFADVKAAMKPNGIFAFFENNSWNPGTRYIMSRVEFDRDAITITPKEARRLLEDHGFSPIRFVSLFYFPASLAFFRPLERWLRSLPFGGQYLYICTLK